MQEHQSGKSKAPDRPSPSQKLFRVKRIRLKTISSCTGEDADNVKSDHDEGQEGLQIRQVGHLTLRRSLSRSLSRSILRRIACGLPISSGSRLHHNDNLLCTSRRLGRLAILLLLATRPVQAAQAEQTEQNEVGGVEVRARFDEPVCLGLGNQPGCLGEEQHGDNGREPHRVRVCVCVCARHRFLVARKGRRGGRQTDGSATRPPRAFSLSLSLSLSPRIFHLPQRFLPSPEVTLFKPLLNPPGAPSTDTVGGAAVMEATV